MSLRSLTWAIENRDCPSAISKLVLIVLADHLDGDGCAFQAVGTIGATAGLDRKAVIRALDMLEDAELIKDTGRRVGSTGRVKVYKLAIPIVPDAEPFQRARVQRAPGRIKAPSAPHDAKTVPDTGPLNDPAIVPQLSPNSPASGTQIHRNGKPDSPEDAIASSPPTGGPDRGSRIGKDWGPPPIDQLPPAAASIARQWPAGAYGAEGEAFRERWLGERRRTAVKQDWGSAWASHVVTIGAKPLRDAKAGVRHVAPGRPGERSLPPRIAAVDDDDDRVRHIRAHLARCDGYRAWLAPEHAALSVNGVGLIVAVRSAFHADRIGTELGDELRRAAAAVLGVPGFVARVATG